MLDNFDLLDSVGPDLDEARARIEAARDALQTMLDAQDCDLAPIHTLVSRLNRMATELRRAEETVNTQVGAVGGVS